MKANNPLDELYVSVLRDLWLYIQLNNNNFSGIVYKPENDSATELLFRLQNKDGVLRIRNKNEKSDFASIISSVKPGSLILDILKEPFLKLSMRYELYEERLEVGKTLVKDGRYLRKLLNNELGNIKLSKKQNALINYLKKDFKAKTQSEIINEVGTQDLPHLIMESRKRLKQTSFKIQMNKSKYLGSPSTYQLQYIHSEN